jgi:hypothetical protein
MDQSPQAKIDHNPHNTFKMEKIEPLQTENANLSIPSNTIGVEAQKKVQYLKKTVFENRQEYLEEIKRQNPNIVLDQDEMLGPMLLDILSNQKDLI